MDFKKIRLKWKIFAFLFGFCALLLMILWLFQTVFLTDMYRSIRTRELRNVIATVEREIDNPDINEILYQLQIEHDIIVAYTRDFVLPHRPEGTQNTQIRRGGMNLDTITEEKVFIFENGQTVSLTFHAVIMPVNATVTTLRYQLYWISGIMIVLAVIIAFVIAKHISKPIEEITKSAGKLGAGDYGVRFNGKGFCEIMALSDTLNTTAFELGKVEGLRREFLSNVSHDLRTPLALIYSYAELMNDFPGEITQAQTRVIMDETQRLTTLVNDLIALSKLESDIANIEKLNFSEYCLTESISETVGRMNELLKNDGFKIDFFCDGDVTVKADKSKIDRVFYNLLINAVNYSGDNREIAVTQTVTKNNVRVTVADNGEGIGVEELPYIWDRYYKSGKAHKRAVTGTGLGLSIVKRIMELHGGSYGVESEFGKGSVFWFELKIQ